MPTDLRKALAAAPISKARWSDLTPIARRDFISWVEGAKQPETRKRRVERTCEMVADGKKRPCCFSIVPLDLHLALKAAPKAKAKWSALTASEKRDLIGWIELATERDARVLRIQKACTMLVNGKRVKG